MASRAEYFGLPRYLMLACASIILVATFAPMEFAMGGFSARLFETAAWELEGGWSEVLAHFVAFLGLGLLLRRVVSSAYVAGVTVLCFCLGLEAVQLLFPDRHARIGDILVNIAAMVIGCWAAGKGNFQSFVFEKDRALILRGILASVIVVWLLASFGPALFLSLDTWQHDCRIVIGNELDGSEPWMGTVSRLAIARGSNPGASGDDGLLYQFAGAAGSRIRSEESHSAPELDLILPQKISARNGVQLTNGAVVSAGSAAKISQAITSTGAFTIFAEIPKVFESTNLAGRLISLSSTASARNFMLGREGDDLVFRVRNGVMEENGTRHILRARNSIDGAAMRLQASYNAGAAAIFKNGTLLKRIDLRQPTVLLGLGNVPKAGLCAGILLGVLAAFPAYTLLPLNKAASHACALGGTVLLSTIPYLIVCKILGGPVGLSFIGMTSVAIGLAYLVAHFYCSHKVNALLQSGSSGSRFPR